MHAMPGSTITSYQGHTPKFGANVFLAAGAHIVGDVVLSDDVSVWFNTVVRGDCNFIRVGARTNIQDGSVIHVTHGTGPTVIGADVTIGHGAIIHGCTIEDLCLIGMGATILDGAVISQESLVGAGALVTPGKKFPPRSLIIGSPARVARALTNAEVASLRDSVDHYLEYKKHY